MVDNFKLIESLLQFDSPDDFYMIQILKRRKDNPDMKRDMELIDTIFIYSKDDLNGEKGQKIRFLCVQHNARAYIRLNRRSMKKVAMMTLKKVTDLIVDGNFKAVKRAYISAAGEHHSEPNKTWIVDIDEDLKENIQQIEYVIDHLCKPFTNESKIIAKIPTVNGFHFITYPFNIADFNIWCSVNPDIHKDNPTILYTF